MPCSLLYLLASSRISFLLRGKQNTTLAAKIVSSQAIAFSSSSQSSRSQPDSNGSSSNTINTSILSIGQQEVPPRQGAAAQDKCGRKNSDKIKTRPTDIRAHDIDFQETSRRRHVDNASFQRMDDARLDVLYSRKTNTKIRRLNVSSRVLPASEEQKPIQRLPWQVQKQALAKKFGDKGWNPRKRLSPDTLDGIRALHTQFPEEYPTSVLAERFKVSPEAIRRILKSKWKPNEAEQASRRLRWDKRGAMIWSEMVELGMSPPKKWREMGIRKKREPEKDGQLHRKSYGGRDMIKDRQISSIEVINSPTTSKRAEEVPRGLSLADRIL